MKRSLHVGGLTQRLVKLKLNYVAHEVSERKCVRRELSRRADMIRCWVKTHKYENSYAEVTKTAYFHSVLKFYLQFARTQKFTIWHCYDIGYLQYGGVYYCRQNGVTVNTRGRFFYDTIIKRAEFTVYCFCQFVTLHCIFHLSVQNILLLFSNINRLVYYRLLIYFFLKQL